MSGSLRRHWRAIVQAGVIAGVGLELSTNGTGIGIVVAVAEGLLLLLVLFKLPRIVGRFRRHRREIGDGWEAAERAISTEVGGRLVRFGILEAKLWSSLVSWLLRRPLPPGSFSYQRDSLVWGLVVLVVVSAPAEILLFHVLLPWEWLKTLLLILGIYGVFWVFGYAASFSRFPHRLTNAALLVRSGAMGDAIVPLASVASVTVARQKFDMGVSGIHEGAAGGAAAFVVNGETQVLIELATPITIRKIGKDLAGVRSIRLAADEPDCLVRKIRARLTPLNGQVLNLPRQPEHDRSAATQPVPG